MIIVVLAALMLMGILPNNAYAKTAVGFAEGENSPRWMFDDGTYLTNDWLRIKDYKWYFDADGIMQTGFVTVDNKTYYLSKDGTFGTGWLQIDKDVYYFDANGVMAKNTTLVGVEIGADGKAKIPAVDNAANVQAPKATPAPATVPANAQATLNVNPNAPIVNTALAQYVGAIISSVTTSSMTQEQKLRACYDYVINYASYKRTYETPSGDWTGQFALELLSSGYGNCYRYAAAFAYLAKGLGYDVKVSTGQIQAARGGVTPHGWTEVCIDGNWYIFDSEMADAKATLRDKMWKRTYSNYVIKPLNKLAEWPVNF